jgi:catechol 2,3-dioxygenase-like lactoylglutathione lyase family enzyme
VTPEAEKNKAITMATVRYIVDDVNTAVDFYTQRLGFRLGEKMGPGPAFASVLKDGVTVWLSGPQSSAARPMPDGRQPVAGGWNRFVVQVEDIEATVNALKKAGVRFRNEIVSGPGGKQILLEDPSGNPIELFQPA